MLPSEKNDLLYLLNILEYIGKIWKYTEKINNPEELFELNDQMNLNASLTLLVKKVNFINILIMIKYYHE